ncbi:hypothetical protein ACWD2L_06080 [Streptomyces sp. NPDC002754]
MAVTFLALFNGRPVRHSASERLLRRFASHQAVGTSAHLLGADWTRTGKLTLTGSEGQRAFTGWEVVDVRGLGDA